MRLIILLLCAAAVNAATIGTYNFPEPYGVSHPSQIVTVDQPSFNQYTAKLLGPNGLEVAYQKMTNGQISFQGRLPASTSPIVFDSTPSPRASGSIFWAGLLPNFPLPGTAVYFQATTPTCLSTNTVYYIFDNNYFLDQGVRFTATPGGSVIDCTAGGAYGTSPKITLTGFTAVAATDTFTAPNHQRLAGDPIRFSGTCPTGLTCDGVVVYYVIASGLTANAFKVSATVGGSAVNLTSDVTTGLNQLITNWTWTLVDTGAPTATITNPIVLDSTNSDYIQLTNGLTGVRILKPLLGTPYTVAGGTLTSCVANGVTMDCGGMTGASTTMPPGSTVSISGNEEPQNVYTVSSNPTSSSIRVPTSRSSTYSNSFLAVTPGHAGLNPIQGILLGGAWLGGNVATSYLTIGPQNGNQIGIAPDPEHPRNYSSNNRAASLKILEAGPIKTVIEFTYTGYRQALVDGSNNPISGSTEGVDGTYTMRFTMLAGSKTVAVRESGDENYGNWLDVYTNWPGSKPDRIGNRDFNTPGSGASNSCGATGPITINGATNANPIVVSTRTPHGITFQGIWTVTIAGVVGNIAANTTATATPIDQYNFSIPVAGNGSYTSGGNVEGVFDNGGDSLFAVTKAIDYGQIVDINAGCNSVTRPPMGIWNFHQAGGVQQWVYKYGGLTTDPALGIFPGKASVQNASINSVTGFTQDTTPILWAYTVQNPCQACTSVGEVFSAATARETDFYTGTIADITPNGRPQDPSPMSLEQNWVAGISMDDLYSFTLNFPDPGGGWTFCCMSDVSAGTIRDNYQNDNPSGYTALMNTSVGASDPTLITMATDNAASITTSIITPALLLNLTLINGLVNRNGIFDLCCAAITASINIGTVLVNDTNALANPNVTAAQTLLLKADLAVNCSLPWDQDYLPLDFNNLGGGSGPNQVQSIIAGKYRCVAALPTQPYLAAQGGPTVVSSVSDLITSFLNPVGAPNTSVHYTGSFTNTLFMALSLKKQSLYSPITTPKLGYLSGWWRNAMTPPEPRFGTSPMCPSIGDGVTEQCGTIGLLATMYDTVDTTISQDAIATWFAVNRTARMSYSNFYGADFLSIDSTITDPGFATRSSILYPGYFGSLRHGAGTANEHWVAFISGTFLTDHTHQDHGCLDQFYAFKSPVMGDLDVNLNGWGSAFLHSCAVYDASLTWNWYDPPTTVELPPQLGDGVNLEFIAGTKFTHMCAVMSVWTRCTTLINTTPTKPIVHDKNTFTGGSAAKTMTYVIDYDGQSVSAMGSPVTPTYSLIPTACNAVGYPSGGTPVSVPAGIQKFSFTGQYWPSISDGVNLDLYMGGSASMEFVIGDWRQACQIAPGQSAYQAANSPAISTFTATSGTVADLVFTNWVPLKGQTGTISGVTGTGMTGLSFPITVTTASGHTATVSGLSGLTGSYSGGSVQWNFMEDYAMMRFHDTDNFDATLLPYQKSGSASAAPTAITSGDQIVNGGETTTYGPSFVTFTDGTLKLLGALDTNSLAGFNITLTGGAQEIVCATSTSCTWTVTGITAGTRSLDMSAFGGTWYVNGPVTKPSTNKFSVYFPGGSQPIPYTFTLSTTPNTAAPRLVSYGKPSGVTTMRVLFNGQYVSSVTCGSTACTSTILAESGFTETHNYQ